MEPHSFGVVFPQAGLLGTGQPLSRFSLRRCSPRVPRKVCFSSSLLLCIHHLLQQTETQRRSFVAKFKEARQPESEDALSTTEPCQFCFSSLHTACQLCSPRSEKSMVLGYRPRLCLDLCIPGTSQTGVVTYKARSYTGDPDTDSKACPVFTC